MLIFQTWALAIKETKSRFAGHTIVGPLSVYALLALAAERVITLINVWNTHKLPGLYNIIIYGHIMCDCSERCRASEYIVNKSFSFKEAEQDITFAGVVLQLVSCPAHTPEAAECVLTVAINTRVRDQTTLINICHV